jgi:hypothetical protein
VPRKYSWPEGERTSATSTGLRRGAVGIRFAVGGYNNKIWISVKTCFEHVAVEVTRWIALAIEF